MIQRIFHTSDIHSHFDKIFDVKNYVNDNDLLFDSGDFSDGGLYYFADNFRMSWRIMDEIGYDAITIGNHDYYAGDYLNTILKNVKPKTTFLSSNLSSNKKYIKKYIQKYKLIEKNGIRYLVLALTSDSIIFKWSFNKVKKPKLKIPCEYDKLIVLSHQGLTEDIALMENNKIDVLLSGHHHISAPPSKINGCLFITSGFHGDEVSEAIIDFRANTLLGYKKHKLKNTEHELLKEAEESLKSYNIDKIIAFNCQHEIYENQHYETPWSKSFVRWMKTATKADIAISFPFYFRSHQEGGNITLRKMMSAYPSAFGYSPEGNKIWTTNVFGTTLKIILRLLKTLGYSYSMAYDMDKIKCFKKYKIATPEGALKGLLKTHKRFSVLFRNAKETDVRLWDLPTYWGLGHVCFYRGDKCR